MASIHYGPRGRWPCPIGRTLVITRCVYMEHCNRFLNPNENAHINWSVLWVLSDTKTGGWTAVSCLQNHFTKSRWSWCAMLRSHVKLREAPVITHRKHQFSLSTSHGNPLTLTTANLADDAKPLRYNTLPYILFSSAVNWDTPPRSRKVKVNDFGGTDFLHCHTPQSE